MRWELERLTYLQCSGRKVGAENVGYFQTFSES